MSDHRIRTGLRFLVWLWFICVAATLPSGQTFAQDQGEPAAEQPAQVQASPDSAASPSNSIRVGLYLSPPFVMRDGDGYAGMAFDLWESVTEGLGIESEYVVAPTVRDLVDMAAEGEVDAAVTNLTINKRRAERIDFTQPWFDAGLRIMIDENQGAGFWAMVQGLRDAGFLRAYAWIAFVIVVATILLTIFDRRFDTSFPTRWRDGVAESFYTVMSVATTGRMSRKNLFGWIGRIWSALWLVCGVAVLAYVTSTVTSVMTTIALTNQIRNADDLYGKTIGVLAGGTAEEFAEENGIAVSSYADIDEAVSALLRGRIDAVVGDAPNLEYYAFTNPEDPVRVVGPIFQPEKYGFGVSQKSELTRAVTLQILDAFEGNEVEEFRARYLGERPGN
ncbi:transporter substrate-binding domain-containing protein [Microbaculum marinum]|uniref:Transporter substrate-binding domain-containing protein n=1 Tax=Microbaculum marinum TaxID=1764581 RepID=A0AAW9RPI9_9HYPH